MTIAESPIVRGLEGLAEDVEGVRERWKVPGLSIAVVKDGQMVMSDGFGFRDLDQKLPVTTKTVFAIGSSTKAFTTMALGTLVDEGKLDWDAPVRQYIPWFQLHDPMASERISVRDLVTHRSGLPRYDMLWYNNTTETREELIRRLRYLPPSADFRTVFQYQNLMYLTAGYLAGELAGSNWETAVRDRILDPLGMSSANFSVRDSQASHDFALPYSDTKGEFKQINFRNIDLVGPAGSINANVEDMAKWALLHLNRGKHGDRQIVSETQVAEMHRTQMWMQAPYLPVEEASHGSYGLAWFIESYNGDTVIHHGGAIDGFLGVVGFVPKHNIGVVVQTNLGGSPVPFLVMYNILDRLRGRTPSALEPQVRKIYDEAREALDKGGDRSEEDRVKDTHPSHALSDYTGSYANAGLGTVTIASDAAGLTYTFHDETFSLKHYHYDVFDFREEIFGVRFPVNFRTGVAGDIDSLVIALETAMPPQEFLRTVDPTLASREFLRQFVGEYEIMSRIATVSLENENLLALNLPGQPRHELEPHRGSEFKIKGLDGFRVEFKLDAAGEVTHAVLIQPMGVFEAKRMRD
ncbi:MAG TPA: serine hydrolase [Chloroflexota bacterium]|jgi:CubicO group peptidase (beta-lactamase class C family)|nr:serine hydrolase [Chloroflexota bacterium]